MAGSSPLSLITDKEALISFKSSVVLEPERQNPLSTWEQNLSPCNWSGVSCNKLGQRVIGLQLSGLGMGGSISPYIGNLSFLRSLELQDNQLTGKLPDQLGNLFQLRTLNVSFNRLEGVIPSNLSQCRELRVIDLSQNLISGTIPDETSNLMQLQVLNLSRNQLSGDLPSSLANISSLVILNLGTNRLSGSIPSDLSRLVNLMVLDLTVNNFSGTVPPSIYNSSSLVYLALASNNLWGDLPGDIGLTSPNLLGFNFCINKFTGTIPWSLQNLTNIEIIRMAHNRLHGTIPPGLGNLPKLKMYNIGFNNIYENGLGFLEPLSNSTQLDFLAFDSNLLEGVIPTSIGNLSKVLKNLYMGGNNIYGTIPSSIGELTGLELLSLMNNHVSGEIPQVIGRLKELRVLTLAENRLSGRIPDSLGNLQQLTEIDLSKNQLTGSIPITFGNLQNLISMDLSYNNLNGSIPKEIVSLSRLSIFLNLSDNQLTGTLPEQIGILENTMEIVFSENKLFGNIPKSIGNCKSLEKLVLARNTFSGPIPGSLGDVKGLVTLDLSSNQLSGEIPLELQKLLSLQLLNLSFNNLEGQVPTGGIFSEPSKVHLEHNRNICSDLSCGISRGRGRRLTIIYIIISIAVTISLCFAIVLLYFFWKGNGMTIIGSFESLKVQHEMISYSKLRLATSDFDQENLIGRGSFGCVYKGILEGAIVAVKVLDMALPRPRKCFLAECAALKHLRHRNLVKLLTICSSVDSRNEEFLALVFPFMRNGSLDDWIRGKRRHADGAGLSALERLRSAIGIASAIDYMHNETEVPILHCDLKPSNVLMDTDMTPKVADFGIAKLLLNENQYQSSHSLTHTLKGSIGYIPPEYGYGEKPSTAGDVYSFGILLLELFTGKCPTDEIFSGGLTLTSWVKSELDANLLEEKNEIWENTASSKLEEQKHCMATVFGVGLSCSADLPGKRIGIKDALSKLKSVEKTILQNVASV
ncbi:Serine-threonine protein kinase, plant-type [Dorcoceras hygrometricum]|uniref:non-specific serine/threonine protein kinase n=1 Tax=Dorcoceras hygrometricum TaxID=472368 RepID=A0A2Z7DAY8_9LAMI|nr:Serine-threonine protein kinase, plant-type [Dorcoceras hygrometricum]